MAKKRSVKSFQELRESYVEQDTSPTNNPQKNKGEVIGTCIQCGKTVYNAFYGRYSDLNQSDWRLDNSGVCSKTCNEVQESQPKFPDRQEEQELRA